MDIIHDGRHITASVHSSTAQKNEKKIWYTTGSLLKKNSEKKAVVPTV